MSNHTFFHCMAEAAILVLSVYIFFLKTSFIEDNSGPSRACHLCVQTSIGIGDAICISLLVCLKGAKPSNLSRC